MSDCGCGGSADKRPSRLERFGGGEAERAAREAVPPPVTYRSLDNVWWGVEVGGVVQPNRWQSRVAAERFAYRRNGTVVELLTESVT